MQNFPISNDNSTFQLYADVKRYTPFKWRIHFSSYMHACTHAHMHLRTHTHISWTTEMPNTYNICNIGECEWPHKIAFINKSIFFNYNLRIGCLLLQWVLDIWWRTESRSAKSSSVEYLRIKRGCVRIILYAAYFPAYIKSHRDILLFLQMFTHWIVWFVIFRPHPNFIFFI